MQKEYSYRPIFVDRKTGEESPADYLISLPEDQVILHQIEYSTVKTAVMLKRE